MKSAKTYLFILVVMGAIFIAAIIIIKSRPWFDHLKLAKLLIRGELLIQTNTDIVTPIPIELRVVGTNTAAWLYMHPEAKGRAIVVHGKSSKAHKEKVAQMLIRTMFNLAYHVLSIDLRGYGQSHAPGGACNPENFDFGDDVIEAVKWFNFNVPGNHNPVVIGHSLGASAILLAMAKSDLMDLAILFGTPFHKIHFDENPKKIRNRSRGIIVDMGLITSAECIDAMSEILLNSDPNNLNIERPILFIFGDEEGVKDPAFNLAKKSIKHEVTLISGVGHYLGVFPSVFGLSLQNKKAHTQIKDEISDWLKLHRTGNSSVLDSKITNSLSEKKPLSGQLIADPLNPAWLAYYGGGPFFMAGPGDPEDFLYRGKRNLDGTRNGDQAQIIDKLKGTGANSIYVQAIRSHGGDGDSTHNPFINNDSAKGMNEKLLDQWEGWFSELNKNGVVIFFIFYDDGSRTWDTGDYVFADERHFIRQIVNRFEHHKNLIWVVAEEYEEAFSPERVSNIAKEIKQADDFNHVVAVHRLDGLKFEEFADDPFLDQFAVQYNRDTREELHEGILRAWETAAGRYNLVLAEANNFGIGATARKKLWAVALAGAYVMALGWDIINTPTQTLKDCGNLVNFMMSTNFNEMEPHDELGSGDTEYVLARPSSSYIAYTSAYKQNIGLKDMVLGTYDFKWYDTKSGKSILWNNVNVAGGIQTWQKPSGMGNELAVYIRRSNS